MVLELVGSRLLAPYFGNSLFVWTALIGIMLGFMSLGNYLGGRIADKHLSVQTLYWILLVSSAGIAIVAFLEPVVLPMLGGIQSLRLAAVIASVVLFAIPCVALGMITPFSARYAITSLDSSGQMVGSLFALGTLGSIAGTFIGGFYVIALVGSHDLIAWLALLALLLAAIFIRRPFEVKSTAAFVATAILIALAFVASASAIDSFDTDYDRYFIETLREQGTGRPITTIARDFKSIESAVYADTGEPYRFDYFKYYDLALKLFESSGQPLGRTALIGGGTFSYPRHQLIEWPDSSTDVVEIDPALVEVAREHFFLTDDPRMGVFSEDGRTFLNRAVRAQRESGDAATYDAIILDAFKSANSIPYQMTTVETMQACYDLLSDRGVLVMNVIASHRGAGSRFVSAQYRTIAQVFPQVNLYAVYDVSSDSVQNISIIAVKGDVSDVDLTATLQSISPELTARKINPAELSVEKILTDELAPADQLLSGIETR